MKSSLRKLIGGYLFKTQIFVKASLIKVLIHSIESVSLINSSRETLDFSRWELISVHISEINRRIIVLSPTQMKMGETFVDARTIQAQAQEPTGKISMRCFMRARTDTRRLILKHS